MAPPDGRTKKTDSSIGDEGNDSGGIAGGTAVPEAPESSKGTPTPEASPAQIASPQAYSEENFLAQIEASSELATGFIVSSPSIATRDEIEGVITNIIKDRKLIDDAEGITRNKIRLNMGVLLHQGATSPKCDKNKISNYWNFNLSVRTLDSAISKIPGLTARKVARGMRREITAIAQRTGLPGNLSKRYRINFPLADAKELVWVSDYNTFSDDPSMPENVRKWLAENLKARFE